MYRIDHSVFNESSGKWFEEILIYRQQSFLRRQESS